MLGGNLNVRKGPIGSTNHLWLGRPSLMEVLLYYKAMLMNIVDSINKLRTSPLEALFQLSLNFFFESVSCIGVH